VKNARDRLANQTLPAGSHQGPSLYGLAELRHSGPVTQRELVHVTSGVSESQNHVQFEG